MKAIIRRRFGSPDVLEFADVPPPAIGRHQILVGVRAAGVNRGDALENRGWPYLARLTSYGFRRPRRAVPGTDVAGTVVAVGADVTGIDVDDEVVGWAEGAFAALVVMGADRVVLRPGIVTAVEAAAVPTAAVAALQALRAADRVGAGSDVLVIGASGGVGSFAVQIAKLFGATVTGVAGSGNVEFVRSLGADDVVDYRAEEVTTRRGRFDVIVDLVGNRPLGDVRRALTRRGTLVVVGGQDPQTITGMRRFASAAVRSSFIRQRLVPLFASQDRDDLALVVAMVASGDVRPAVGATVDLSDTAAAFRRVETGHASGKLVVTV